MERLGEIATGRYTPQPDGTLHNHRVCAQARLHTKINRGQRKRTQFLQTWRAPSTDQNEILEPSGCGVACPMEGALEHGPSSQSLCASSCETKNPHDPSARPQTELLCKPASRIMQEKCMTRNHGGDVIGIGIIEKESLRGVLSRGHVGGIWEASAIWEASGGHQGSIWRPRVIRIDARLS